MVFGRFLHHSNNRWLLPSVVRVTKLQLAVNGANIHSGIGCFMDPSVHGSFHHMVSVDPKKQIIENTSTNTLSAVRALSNLLKTPTPTPFAQKCRFRYIILVYFFYWYYFCIL